MSMGVDLGRSVRASCQRSARIVIYILAVWMSLFFSVNVKPDMWTSGLQEVTVKTQLHRPHGSPTHYINIAATTSEEIVQTSGAVCASAVV
jgi:hypothetical protein